MTRLPDRDPDLTFVVYGEAKPKGSVKSFIPRRKDGSMVTRPNGDPMVVKTDDSSVRGKQWMGAVASAAAEAMQDAGVATVPAKVPVVIEMMFYRPRPASHFGSGRNSDIVKASAPMTPSTRPDADKLCRSVLDALKGIAWVDDGQVTGAIVWKEFGTPARCEMRLWRLPASVAAASVEDSEAGSPQNALFLA